MALRDAPSRLGSLPSELQIRIFILAQNPHLATVSNQFWKLSQLSVLRARYLVQRFGQAAALGERAMKYKIASVNVIDNMLKLNCNPRADGDWLYWKACELHNVRLCALLLDAIQPNIQVQSHFLNVAAMKGAIAIIDLLVERYQANVHYPNGDDVALTLACTENQVGTARHLMTKYGCDAHSNNERHLRRACLHGYVELAQLLLTGADVHAYNDAALQNAVHKGHSDIVELLLQAGAYAQANSNAPIQFAVANHDVASVRRLLDAGADPRCHQDRPMRLACRRGATAIMQILLDAGVEPDAKKGMPLREALRSGVKEAVVLLLTYHADPNSLGARRGICEAVQRNDTALISIMARTGARLNYPELLQCLSSENSLVKKETKDLILQWSQLQTLIAPS